MSKIKLRFCRLLFITTLPLAMLTTTANALVNCKAREKVAKSCSTTPRTLCNQSYDIGEGYDLITDKKYTQPVQQIKNAIVLCFWDTAANLCREPVKKGRPLTSNLKLEDYRSICARQLGSAEECLTSSPLCRIEEVH